MGKLTNLNPVTPIADADLPASITRDTELAALGIQNPASSIYGSVSIRGILGEKNNFAGINFPIAYDSPTFMVDTLARLNGMWSPTNGWHWNYNKGKFSVYSEPIASANQRGTYISLDKSAGSHPSFPALDWPFLRTDATTLFLSIGGQVSASISASGTYTTVSDKNRKENAVEVDYARILNKFLKIPIYTYNFKEENAKIKRCGCYAQDFFNAFGLGGEEQDEESPVSPSKTISSSDQIGVLWASLKALAEKVSSLEEKLELKH